MDMRGSVARTGVLVVMAMAALYPAAWVAWMSLGHYRQLFADQPFGRWLVNSLFVASTQTVSAVVLASLGGFAVAKYRFAGRRPILAVLLSVLLLPYQVLLPGAYELVRALHGLDTYWAVMAPGASSVFGLILFSRAMRQVDDDVLAAGRIDGCSEPRLWWSIALPLVRPMTAAFALLTFAASWNAFLWPQVVLQDDGKYTLPLGLASLSLLPGQDVGALMAATVLSVLPVTVLFFAVQSDFVAGLTSGATKG
jgi:ABC-type glycerol-3-phosphate transport system permease component